MLSYLLVKLLFKIQHNEIFFNVYSSYCESKSCFYLRLASYLLNYFNFVEGVFLPFFSCDFYTPNYKGHLLEIVLLCFLLITSVVLKRNMVVIEKAILHLVLSLLTIINRVILKINFISYMVSLFVLIMITLMRPNLSNLMVFHSNIMLVLLALIMISI